MIIQQENVATFVLVVIDGLLRPLTMNIGKDFMAVCMLLRRQSKK